MEVGETYTLNHAAMHCVLHLDIHKVKLNEFTHNFGYISSKCIE